MIEGVQVTQEKIDYAEPRIDACMGPGTFNREGWEHIVNAHEGRLPVRIKAVPEGMIIPISNALMTVENTDPKCYWLTNFLETLLSKVWYTSTVATQSYYMKKDLLKYLKETGTPEDVDFKLHDFGYRGVSSEEQAGLGGMAHLVNFKGTDTFVANEYATDYYGADMAGFSIPASEHSTITSWGELHEADAYENMLDVYKGPMACVSDSFNIYNSCWDIWGDKLRDKVLNREGVTVIRPDSGDPHVVLPEILKLLAIRFGAEKNSKGYMVLHPQVRVIQGDGIDRNSMGGILRLLKDQRWSADNIAFGSGGGLLQKVDRDTSSYAFKCSAIRRNNVWHDVFKDPVDGGKKSKKGRLKLVGSNGHYSTVTKDSFPHAIDVLETVFENGELIREYSFDEIRNNALVKGMK
jgi:nicotinamide phosphoribosyltransferase